MSRSGYSDEEEGDYPNAGALYRANVEAALWGRRGQAVLRELEAAIVAIPEKRLIRWRFADESGDVCALGAVLCARGVKGGLDRRSALYPLVERSIKISAFDEEELFTKWAIEEIDAAKCFLNEVQYMNDEAGPRDETPEARYERVLKWVRKEIRPEVATV